MHRAATMSSSRRAVSRATPSRQTRDESARQCVVDGLRACLRAGEADPTAERIADLAEVSTGIAKRHLRDLDGILCEALRLEYESAPGHVPDRDAPFDRRVADLVTQRVRRHERLAGVYWACLRVGAGREIVQAHHAAKRRRDRAEVAEVLSPELSARASERRRETVAALSAALSPGLWSELRRGERLSRRASQAVVQALVKAALQPAARAAGLGG